MIAKQRVKALRLRRDVPGGLGWLGGGSLRSVAELVGQQTFGDLQQRHVEQIGGVARDHRARAGGELAGAFRRHDRQDLRIGDDLFGLVQIVGVQYA